MKMMNIHSQVIIYTTTTEKFTLKTTTPAEVYDHDVLKNLVNGEAMDIQSIPNRLLKLSADLTSRAYPGAISGIQSFAV